MAVPADDKVFFQFGIPKDWKEGKEVVVELPSRLRLRFYPSTEHAYPGATLAFSVPQKETVPGSAKPKVLDATTQTRYVTIMLPVGGGKEFRWTVDGVERTFVAPDGKSVGDEHEFTFEA